ncbi:hypothetical protein L2E82_52534 [Cichorium intybus]|nr:hypothetical protein L2E82_52534 [Cichorium intybus]
MPDQGSADVAFRTPLAPYEKSKFLGSGGSMVARLKLKELTEGHHQEWSLRLNLTQHGKLTSLLTSYVEVSLHGQLLRGDYGLLGHGSLRQ